MKKIRILVADDHAVVRMGLVALFEAEQDIEVVGEAGDGVETLAVARRTRPGVILMDLVMPRKDGVEATASVKAEWPQTKVLILTTFSSAGDIARAIDAGADGVLLKNSDYSEVAAAIRAIADGKDAIAPEVRKMIAEYAPMPNLTRCQKEVLDLMSRGFTNSDIARHLGITPDGVNDHVRRFMQKLGAANRTEAVAIAIRRHLLKA